MRVKSSKKPTLKQLELLIALSSSESISTAGAKLGMTPSGTSHTLRALETALGGAVVDRNASHLTLSAIGQQILPHARDVFASLELVEANAAASAELRSGQLRIGSFGHSASMTLLPPIVDDFRQRYPGIEVSVTEQADPQIEQELVERRLEVGMVTLPREQFDTLHFTTDTLVAVVPDGHSLCEHDPVDLHELEEYPFIMTRAGSQHQVRKMFDDAGLVPKIKHEMQQLLSILEFVAAGQGVSVVGALSLPDEHPGVTYLNLTPRFHRHMGLACLDSSRLSPAARAFWDHAETHASRR